MSIIRNYLQFLVLIFLFSCTSKKNEIKIGYQTWANKNLDVIKFRNGEDIQEVRTSEEWNQAYEDGRPAWCFYNNDPENGKNYGKLYNWFAVYDSRGLAPKGWHVPSKEEWKILIDFAGGRDKAASILKAADYWVNNQGGKDSLGFKALPGGFRNYEGEFKKISIEGIWWCKDGYKGNADMFVINESDNIYGNYVIQGYGYSVRCIKDN